MYKTIVVTNKIGSEDLCNSIIKKVGYIKARYILKNEYDITIILKRVRGE